MVEKVPQEPVVPTTEQLLTRIEERAAELRLKPELVPEEEIELAELREQYNQLLLDNLQA